MGTHPGGDSSRRYRQSISAPPKPDKPAPANPQARFHRVLLIFHVLLLGVLPVATLIFLGYFAPPTVTCNGKPMGPGGVCTYHGHNYTYAQGLSVIMFDQWVARVVSIVWALVTVRFAILTLRSQAIENARGVLTVGDWPRPADRGTARRNRALSTLTTVGIIICVLGVLVLLYIPLSFSL
ncbi:MAG TPA: hypothetical protein VF916_02145 [Ktedonobacterales bacterium]